MSSKNHLNIIVLKTKKNRSTLKIFVISAYETTLAEGIHFEKKIFYATFATVSFVEVLFLSKMAAYPVNNNRQFSSALIVS